MPLRRLAYVEVANDSTAFGEDLPEGTLVLDIATGVLYRLSQSELSTVTLQTATAPVTVSQGSTAEDHGTLQGLGDDDHTQYLLVDGTRAMTGNLDMAGSELRLAGANESIYATGGSLFFVAGGNQNVSINGSQILVQGSAVRLDSGAYHEVVGSATPGVSSAGEGRIYFDSGLNKFRVSEHGGGFVDLVSSFDAEAVDDRVAVLIQDGTGISWVYDDGLDTLTPTITLSPFSTTDLSEGTNLYYTQARFDSAFTVKSTTDLSEGTNLYYTDERVDDRVAALMTDSSTVTWSYNDVGGTLTASVVEGGITHNNLSGLTSGNPHTQYALLSGATFTGAVDISAGSLTLPSGATVDTIETTLTNDATHIGTSSAVIAYGDANWGGAGLDGSSGFVALSTSPQDITTKTSGTMFIFVKQSNGSTGRTNAIIKITLDNDNSEAVWEYVTGDDLVYDSGTTSASITSVSTTVATNAGATGGFSIQMLRSAGTLKIKNLGGSDVHAFWFIF